MRVRTPAAPQDGSGSPADQQLPAAHIAGAAHVAHCFETLAAHFAGQPQPSPRFPDTICPLFVTWNKAPRGGGLHLRGRARGDWRLRGCIGTLSPRPLHSALAEYALTAALRDRRFPAVTAGELPLLRCTVSLLHGFERAASWADWQVGAHGLIINFADAATGAPRTATFLPEVAPGEGWDCAAAIDALIRKAGHVGPITHAVRDSLAVTRYQSSAHSMSHEEYAAATAAATATSDVVEPLQPGSPLVDAVRA